MKKNLQVVAHWIPPIPSSFFKIGLFLEIAPHILWMQDKKQDKFYVKMYEMLLLGYTHHGDDFPAKLYKAMDYLNIAGLFAKNCHYHGMQDPFLLPSNPKFCWPETAQLPLQHYIHMLCMEMSTFLISEPGIDILTALHFDLSPNRFQEYVSMDLKLYEIFTTGYRKCDDGEFLAKMKQLLIDIGFFITFRELLEKVDVPPEFDLDLFM